MASWKPNKTQKAKLGVGKLKLDIVSCTSFHYSSALYLNGVLVLESLDQEYHDSAEGIVYMLGLDYEIKWHSIHIADYPNMSSFPKEIEELHTLGL